MGKINKLTIYSGKIPCDISFLVISDIHRSKTEGKENLMKIKDLIDLDEIDSIIIPGDIVNDVNDLEDKEFRSRLQEELLSITKYKPTFVSLGNHDQMTHAKNGTWIPGQTQLLKEAIKEIPNFCLIENGEKCDMNFLNISACSPDFNYYEDKDKKKSERESTKDYQRIFKQTYNEKLFSDNTYNIFLTHEPQSIIKLSKENESCIQPNTDLVISGHMHNGLLPNFMQPFMANRGIISPQMQLLPEYAQGVYQLKDTTFLINGPINTRIETPFINNLYGPNASVVTLKKTR